MKKLIIMRHCKSDWSSGAASDHDRPLNKRGRRNATALGEWLRGHDHLPDEVLCSSAERTVETARRLDLPQGVSVNVTRNLYLAEPEQMLAALQKASGDVVLMVGHNPGSAAFASELASDRPAHPDFPRYPSGATLVLGFEVDHWANIKTGKELDFIVPRDL